MSNVLTNGDQATIDLQTRSNDLEVTVSSALFKSSIKRPNSWRWRIAAPIAGMILAISPAPATATPDYWFFDQRRRDVVTSSWVVEGKVGMPISRRDALRIAREIIERAEQRRFETARREAMHGIQWVDEI